MPTDADKMSNPGWKLAGWYALDADGNRIKFFVGTDDETDLITAANADKIRFRDAAISDDTRDVLKLYAYWTEGDLPLYFTVEGNGTIDKETYDVPLRGEDAAQDVTATAPLGYHFTGWKNDRDFQIFADAVLTADQIKSVAWQNGRWYTTTFPAMFAANEFTIHLLT